MTQGQLFDLGTAQGRIEIDTSDLARAGSAAHQAGLGLIAVGAAAVAGFGVAVSAAADFEKSLDHLQAVTNAPQADIQKISDLALQMGRTTVFSANDAAGAIVELGKAGFTTQEILGGVVEAAASLAAAGDLPLTQSTEILANTLRTFHLEASQSVFVANELAGAANASTVEVVDLATSLRYVGGVAAAMNIPLDQVAQALAILGNNGIKGSTAGTSLRRILLELNPATKKQSDTLKDLGIITEGTTEASQELSGADEKLAQLTDKLADAEGHAADVKGRLESAVARQEAAQKKLTILMNTAPVDAREVADAEAEVARTSLRTRDARDALSAAEERLRALRQGASPEDLSDADRAVRSARLGVQQSAQDVKDAENDLAIARRKANPSEIANAELRVEAARLAQETAVDDLETAEGKLADLRKTGQEGTKDVIDAEKDLEKARQDVSDTVREEDKSQEDLTKARQGDLTLTDKIAGAKRELADAERAVTSSQRDSVKAAKEVTDAQTDLRVATELQKNLFFDEQGKARSLKDIFGKLQDATKNLSDAEKTRVLDLIFGSRAVASALILMNQGAQGFDNIQGQIEQATATDVARQRLDNLSGSIKRLKNTINTELIGVGAPFQNVFKTIIDGLISVVLKFGGLPDSVKAAIAGSVAAFGGILVVGGSILLLVGFIARLGRALSTLKGLFFATNTAKQALDKNVPILSGLFGGLRSAILFLLRPLGTLVGAFSGIFEALGAIGAGPIAVIVLGVLELLLILQRLWTALDDSKSAAERIGAAFQAVAIIFLGPLVVAIDFLIDKLFGIKFATGKALEAVGGFLGDVIDEFKSLPGKLPDLIGIIVGFFSALPEKVGEFLSQAAIRIAGFLADLPQNIAYFLGLALGTIIRWGVELPLKIAEFGLDFLNSLVDFLAKIAPTMAKWLGIALGTVIRWGIELTAKAIELSLQFVEGLVSFIISLPDRIFNLLTDTLPRIAEWGVEFISKAIEFGIGFVETLIDELFKLPGRLIEALDIVISTLVEKIPEFADKGFEFAGDFITSLIDGLGDLPDEFIGMITSLIDKGGEFIDKLKNLAEDIAGSFVDGFLEGLDPGSPFLPERAITGMLHNIVGIVDQYSDQIGRIESLSSNLRRAQMQLVPSVDSVTRALTVVAQAQGQAQGKSLGLAAKAAVIQNIHPSEKMSELQLAKKSSDELAWAFNL